MSAGGMGELQVSVGQKNCFGYCTQNKIAIFAETNIAS
jgi:hypothetical protein